MITLSFYITLYLPDLIYRKYICHLHGCLDGRDFLRKWVFPHCKIQAQADNLMTGIQMRLNEFVYVSYFGFLEEQSLGHRFGDRKFTWEVIPRGLSRRLGECGTEGRKAKKGFHCSALLCSVAGLMSFDVLGTLWENVDAPRKNSSDGWEARHWCRTHAAPPPPPRT